MSLSLMRKSLLVVALVGLAAVPAFGTHVTKHPLRSTLVGSPGADATIRGIPSGGAPWTLDQDWSRARLHKNHTLEVRVRGLLITGTGTPIDGTTGPVEAVFASLTCEVPGGTPTVISTLSAALSDDGKAKIKEVLTLPDDCLGPVVLVRASAPTSGDPWIAVSGF